VLPTIVEPLRVEWGEVQVAALAYEKQGKRKEAIEEVRRFHRQLCELRVLDPACGSGNFLYVTLEHLKRLEGEVLNLLHDLGESQGLLDLQGITVGPTSSSASRSTRAPPHRRARAVDRLPAVALPHPRQHQPARARAARPEEHREPRRPSPWTAPGCSPATTASRSPAGTASATSPPRHRRAGARRSLPGRAAALPGARQGRVAAADYIVGNPPFIGAATMRRALGDGYVDAVRGTWKAVPESADFVMYWWHIAGEAVRSGAARRFGFITTNSLRQTFNRRVVQAQLEANRRCRWPSRSPTTRGWTPPTAPRCASR
jgi:hypothetical protein